MGGKFEVPEGKYR